MYHHTFIAHLHITTLLKTIKAYFLPQSQEAIVVIVMVEIRKINIA